ncbi:D-Tyr tRNAtyr deacylase-like domain-containing protein [Mucidula mucida]|nr:D-Tyr tRNAtyr deacylase-like domain-containing protein [Mucidula mucida]
MRAVIQRVASASVAVDGETISKISKGLMVLVGIGSDDTTSDASIIVKKILGIRVFSDVDEPRKMWKTNVKDVDGEILCVSQFTLLADTTKDKPDFHRAMPTEPAKELYSTFLRMLGEAYKPDKIQDGKFGAMMNVSLTNEGPITLTVDSRKFEYVENGKDSNTPKGAKNKKGNVTPMAKE